MADIATTPSSTCRTVTAGAAIAKGAMVKVSAANTVIVTAGNGEKAVGQALTAAGASGDPVTVMFWHPIISAIAAEAITAAATCYIGASGKVQDTTSGGQEFFALQAAAADGDVIEIVRV